MLDDYDRQDLAHEHAVRCILYARERRETMQAQAQVARQPRRPKAKPAAEPEPQPQPQRGRPEYGTIGRSIAGYLAANGPAKASQVAAGLNLDGDSVRFRCKQMYQRKQLVHVGEAKPGQPVVYALAEEAR